MLCAGKSARQIGEIIGLAGARGASLLLTRLVPETLAALTPAEQASLDYDPGSRTAVLGGALRMPGGEPRVAVVTAGTSDLPVAREAIRTLAFNGVAAREIADVGVAGLWRLLRHEEELRRYPVVIAVAGMEGALFSVLAGLVGGVVIAVPTSTGYGAARQGETALHAALASCAPGRRHGQHRQRLRRRQRRAARARRAATSGRARARHARRRRLRASDHADDPGAAAACARQEALTPLELWIPITLVAAFFQNLRSALQKHLKGRLSNTGATFSRFAYAAPLALAYVLALTVLTGEPLPPPNLDLRALRAGRRPRPDHRDGAACSTPSRSATSRSARPTPRPRPCRPRSSAS